MLLRKIVMPALCGLALVQAGWAAPDGWERGSAYNKKFDPKNIVSVDGTVDSIDRDYHPIAGMEPGLAVTVKTAKGDKVQAQVGPIWFTHFYKKKWDVQVGDKVSITGSQVDIGGKKAVMVMQGSKGNLKMTVRSKDGAPVWDLVLEDF
ncbi:hypothetical protein IV102_21350 [bacterium]|nr:hypothetical protein [bacterium]